MSDPGRNLTPVVTAVAILALCASPVALAGQSLDVKENTSADAKSDNVTILVGADGIHASVEETPLGAALAEIARQVGFEFDGDAELLDRPVSFKFDGVSATEALTSMLDRFSYVIIHGAEGNVKRVQLLGERTAPSVGDVVQPGPAGSQQTLQPDSLFDSDLTLEQRLMFETADQNLEPPPELRHYFEPTMEPGAEETGPRIDPDMVIQELPVFEPIESETGPTIDMLDNEQRQRYAARYGLDPDAPAQELPQFEPVTSETGPEPFPIVEEQ